MISNNEILSIFEKKRLELRSKLANISPRTHEVSVAEEKDKLTISLKDRKYELIYNELKGTFYINFKNKNTTMTNLNDKILKYTVATMNRGFIPYVKRDEFLYPFFVFTSLEMNGIYFEVSPILDSYIFENGTLRSEVNSYSIEIVVSDSILNGKIMSRTQLLNKIQLKTQHMLLFNKKPTEDAESNCIALKLGPILTSYLNSLTD